jgi:hypothetical protein
VHHVVMNVMKDVMVHHVMGTATLGLHGDRFSAIRSGLGVSRGLLGARRSSLRGSGRLLGGTGGSLSALRRGGSLRGGRLGFLRGVLPGASSKQRERQCSAGKCDHFRSLYPFHPDSFPPYKSAVGPPCGPRYKLVTLQTELPCPNGYVHNKLYIS